MHLRSMRQHHWVLPACLPPAKRARSDTSATSHCTTAARFSCSTPATLLKREIVQHPSNYQNYTPEPHRTSFIRLPVSATYGALFRRPASKQTAAPSGSEPPLN